MPFFGISSYNTLKAMDAMVQLRTTGSNHFKLGYQQCPKMHCKTLRRRLGWLDNEFLPSIMYVCTVCMDYVVSNRDSFGISKEMCKVPG